MTPEGVKTTPQRAANEPKHLRNKLTDGSIDLGTVTGLPEAVRCTYMYIYMYDTSYILSIIL